MKRALAGILLALGLLAPACDDAGVTRPQWLVSIGTDASLPGFGDRVRVDLLDDDGGLCPTCSRVLDAETITARPLSFGVQPLANGGRRFVRARLYRAENTTATGEPEDPLIDVLGELPALADGVLEVNVLLGMSCFGKPADALALSSCDPATGEETAALRFEAGPPTALPVPGSWGGGDEPCNGEAPPGMVCVPGGVFLMGSRTFVPYGPDFDPVPEQLVRVAPFFMDIAELDVATTRGLVERGARAPQGLDYDSRCTYREVPGENDDSSINCLDRGKARELCEGLGKRLPSEAEWEFAAVDRAHEAEYPWAPTGDVSVGTLCRTAILARGDTDILDASRHCILEEGLPAGPVDGGSPSDITPLGILNLAGNMAEWVDDEFTLYSDDRCWGEQIELHDAKACGGFPGDGIIRGGSWVNLIDNAHGFFRRRTSVDLEQSFVGVRCAQDDTPNGAQNDE